MRYRSQAALEELERGYFSPLSGNRRLAVEFIEGWGYEPSEHPKLLDELEMALGEAVIETAYEVMREHGLHDQELARPEEAA